MASLFVHIRCKPGKAARFEEIVADMIAATRANEPDCLRYEYWRATEPDTYYVVMAFTSVNAFYAHQASPYHTGYMAEFAACFDSIRLEWTDPLGAAHGRFPATVDAPVPAGADPAIAAERARLPLAEASWWAARRRGEGL